MTIYCNEFLPYSHFRHRTFFTSIHENELFNCFHFTPSGSFCLNCLTECWPLLFSKLDSMSHNYYMWDAGAWLIKSPLLHRFSIHITEYPQRLQYLVFLIFLHRYSTLSSSFFCTFSVDEVSPNLFLSSL